MDYLLESGMKDNDYIRKLFINLSPYFRTDEEWKKKMSERRPIVEAKKKSERQTRIEVLQNELAGCKEQIRVLTEERDGVKTYEVIGMLITHKSFGEGIATRYDGKHLSIEFDVGEKSFIVPDAFDNGFLKAEYPNFIEDLKREKEISKRIEELEKNIGEKNKQLKALVI